MPWKRCFLGILYTPVLKLCLGINLRAKYKGPYSRALSINFNFDIIIDIKMLFGICIRHEITGFLS